MTTIVSRIGGDIGSGLDRTDCNSSELVEEVISGERTANEITFLRHGYASILNKKAFIKMYSFTYTKESV